MSSPEHRPPSAFPLVMAIQLVVLILALVGIYYSEIRVSLFGDWGLPGVLLGGLGAGVSFAIALWLTRSHTAAGAALRRHSVTLRALFASFSWVQIVLAAAAAGVCEELLFRAFLQPCIGNLLNPALGIAIASVLFALLHAASVTYFLATLLIGLVLGVLYWYSGSLLLVASWHGIYDLLAIAVLVRRPQWLGLAPAHDHHRP